MLLAIVYEKNLLFVIMSLMTFTIRLGGEAAGILYIFLFLPEQRGGLKRKSISKLTEGSKEETFT